MATAVMTPLAMKFQSLSLKKEFLGSSESYKKLSLKSVSTDVAKLPLVTPVASNISSLAPFYSFDLYFSYPSLAFIRKSLPVDWKEEKQWLQGVFLKP